jgi:predicted ester cyclase
MTVEENKELMRRWYEMDDFKGKPQAEIENTTRSVVAEIFSPVWIAHSPQADMPYEPFIQYNIAFMNAFPDFNCTVEDQIGDRDRVVTRLTMRGTNTGTFRGMPPTGKKIEISAVSVGRFAEGKAVEGWLFSDTIGMMQQLGIIPGQ